MIKKDELVKRVITDLQNKIDDFVMILDLERKKIEVKNIISSMIYSRDEDDFMIIEELTPESIIEYFTIFNFRINEDVNAIKEALYYYKSGCDLEKFKLTEEYKNSFNFLNNINNSLFYIANSLFLDNNVIIELSETIDKIKELVLFLENNEVMLHINDINELEYLENILKNNYNEDEFYEIYKIIINKYLSKISSLNSHQALIDDINLDLETETDEVDNIIEEAISVDDLLVVESSDENMVFFEIDESRKVRFDAVKDFFDSNSYYLDNLIKSKKDSFDRILKSFISNNDIELLKANFYKEAHLIQFCIYAISCNLLHLESYFDDKISVDELDLFNNLFDDELEFCEFFVSVVKEIYEENEKNNDHDNDHEPVVNVENGIQKQLILFQNDEGKSKIEKELKHLPKEHISVLISILESIKSGSLGKSIPVGNYIKFQYIIRESVVVIFKTIDDNHVLIYDVSSADNLSESVYLDKLGSFDKKYLKKLNKIIRENGLEYRKIISNSSEILNDFNNSIVNNKGAK